MRAGYGGMVLRQVGSQTWRKSTQDVIFLPVKLSLNIQRSVGGQFVLPEIGGLTPADDKFHMMSMAFLGPWTTKYPAKIAVTSPNGTSYQTSDSKIVKKWSNEVT